MKAVWITPSVAAAPLPKLSRFERTALDLRAGHGEGCRPPRVRPDAAEHLMTSADEFPNNCGADKPVAPVTK